MNNEYYEMLNNEVDKAANHYQLNSDKLRKAKSHKESLEALTQIRYVDPDDTDLINKTVAIVNDKSLDKNLRIRALKTLTQAVYDSESLVSDLIALVSDKNENAEVRRGALHSLVAVAFNSPALKVQMPKYKEALIKLLDSGEPDLTRTATSVLATYRDPEVQRRLKEGLVDPTKALVSAAKAIQLLGIDPKGNSYKEIRDVVEKTQDADIMLEGVYALAGDKDSHGLIEKFLKNKSIDNEVRSACVSALNSTNIGKYQILLKDIVSDDSEEQDLRAASLNAIAMNAAAKATDKKDPASVYLDKNFNDMLESFKISDHEGLKKVTNQYFIDKEKASE
jgi:HEAT repeat protein